PVGVAPGGTEVVRARGLPARLREGVREVEHVGEVSRGPAEPRRDRKRFHEGRLGEAEVGQVARFPRLLDVGVAEAVVAERRVGVAADLALRLAKELVDTRAGDRLTARSD